MAKQIILITLLSIATILFREQLVFILDGVVYAHNHIAKALHLVFADDEIGRLIQEMIALLIIPVICGVIIASIFWLIKRAKMPHIMPVIWVVWLVLLITMLGQKSIATTSVAHNHVSHPFANFFHRL